MIPSPPSKSSELTEMDKEKFSLKSFVNKCKDQKGVYDDYYNRIVQLINEGDGENTINELIDESKKSFEVKYGFKQFLIHAVEKHKEEYRKIYYYLYKYSFFQEDPLHVGNNLLLFPDYPGYIEDNIEYGWKDIFHIPKPLPKVGDEVEVFDLAFQMDNFQQVKFLKVLGTVGSISTENPNHIKIKDAVVNTYSDEKVQKYELMTSAHWLYVIDPQNRESTKIEDIFLKEYFIIPNIE